MIFGLVRLLQINYLKFGVIRKKISDMKENMLGQIMLFNLSSINSKTLSITL